MIKNVSRKMLKLLSVISVFYLVACSTPAEQISQPMVDCPMRDDPYSLSTLLIDIMLKPEAKAVVSRYWGPVLDQAPNSFLSTTSASFAGILTLPKLASMARLPTDSLGDMERELSALSITNKDKITRCARYDTDPPAFNMPEGSPRILLFEKMTGFRDEPSVTASTHLFETLAETNGWALVITENGAAITPGILQQFDAVIWNNNSGDVLTLNQREAFKDYINNGGGYLGIHGAGGDYNYHWDWYPDVLIGARFIGHPKDPQFNTTAVQMEANTTGIGTGVAPSWDLNEEWYSFGTNPREKGLSIIATVDESRYSAQGHGGQDLRMGDHPVVWAHCVGNGRAFYSAIGHRPEVYAAPEYIAVLQQAVKWVAGKGESVCRNDRQVTKKSIKSDIKL